MQTVLGLTLNEKLLSEIIREAEALIISGTGTRFFACANPHSLAVSVDDALFRESLAAANYLVIDGVGITALGKMLGKNLTPRISGTDFYLGLMDALNHLRDRQNRKCRVFYFGSSEFVLNKIRASVEAKYPHVEVCGLLSPPFTEWTEEEESKMIAEINDSRPDVLWVGMTAPKQEKWIYKNLNRLDVRIVGAIGAVFDFQAGTYNRAPRIACDLGLEWVFRLVKEPRRMWRRTFVSGPKFMYHALKYEMQRVKN